MAATKDELKNMLVSLVNLKVSSEDIIEINITLKTKMSSITLVERYESTEPAEKVADVPVATPAVEPIVAPVKERKKRASKVIVPMEVIESSVIPATVEIEKSLVSTLPNTLSVAASQPTGSVTSTNTKPTGTARIVKLVTFFCKGQNINPADITINLLKEKAFDIIEGYEDSVVQTAIDEFKKANVK